MSRPYRERDRPYDKTEPKAVGELLSELFALRGYGKVQSSRQLQEIWAEVVGQDIADLTRAVAIRNGVLQVAVSNSALLSELASFRKQEFLEEFRLRYADLKVRDMKFKLRSKRS